MSSSRNEQRGTRGRPGGRPSLFGRLGRATLALAAPLVLCLGGCGSIVLSPSSAGAAAGVAEDAGALTYNAVEAGVGRFDAMPMGMAIDAASASHDSGAKLAASPLCGSLAFDGSISCNPDEQSCDPVAVGGTGAGSGSGSSSASSTSRHSGTPSACRVTAIPGEGGMTSQTPMCGAAGSGKSESACTAPSDCAPGFDCVVVEQHEDGAAMTGVCRRYCCSNVCPDPKNSFCHMEPTIGGLVNVPVCNPTAPQGAFDGGAAYDGGGAACQLLDDSTCSNYGYTCQVVNSASGQVACVPPGTATAGQPCEMQNCAAGLSCISGVFPNRTCAQLCNQDNDTCPAGQTCMSNAILANIDSQIGVCAQ